MAKYFFKGPVSGVSIKDEEKMMEILFHNGSQYDLPEHHKYVKTLIALGYLHHVEDKTEPAVERKGYSKK